MYLLTAVKKKTFKLNNQKYWWKKNVACHAISKYDKWSNVRIFLSTSNTIFTITYFFTRCSVILLKNQWLLRNLGQQLKFKCINIIWRWTTPQNFTKITFFQINTKSRVLRTHQVHTLKYFDQIIPNTSILCLFAFVWNMQKKTHRPSVPSGDLYKITFLVDF